MERITYQRTLDVHKNGIQFTLQGVETGDNLSRVVEISLMASGDAIDFPLENLLPIMYVTTPKATEPSIIECTIKDNTVVYEVLPIVEEGITEMQLKLIETSPEGAKRVLVAPRFAVEVTKSNANDGSAIQKSEFTALETAVAKAKAVYDKRFLRMELDSDCIFKAYYADGTIYETDLLKELFHKGESILSQSYARGGTGVRANEDTDNSMYYCNVSKSASLRAKETIENSEAILEEVRLHGVYTAFKVDFESGEVEYVSPTYKFKINVETGALETDGGAYTFEDEIGRIVVRWLEENNVDITKLQAISEKHSGEIAELQITSLVHAEHIEELQATSEFHKTKIEESALEIAKGKEFDEWVTLGSVSSVKTTYITNSAFNMNVDIPFDSNITVNYSEIRLVIKSGSKFKVYSGTNANGSETPQSNLYIYYASSPLISLGASGDYISSGGSSSVNELTLQEDMAYYPIRNLRGVKRTINHNQDISNINYDGITRTVTITTGGNNYGTAEWDFVVEIQGRK